MSDGVSAVISSTRSGWTGVLLLFVPVFPAQPVRWYHYPFYFGKPILHMLLILYSLDTVRAFLTMSLADALWRAVVILMVAFTVWCGLLSMTSMFGMDTPLSV